MPDSPRWLLKAGRRPEATDALNRVQPEVDAEAELDAIESSLAAESDQASWGELLAPAVRRPLVLAVGLALAQQVTGINAVIYYANEVFAEAGFHTPAEQAAATTWSIGVVNALATLIAIAFVDRLGRRPLLLAGLTGMTVGLVLVGLGFHLLGGDDGSGGESLTGVMTLAGLVVFVASFAFS